MKRLICVLVALTVVLLAVPAFADKPTTYTELTKIHGNILFNVIVRGPGEEIKYMPMVVNLDGVAKTQDGGLKGVKVIKTVGTLSDTPLYGKDLYDALPTLVQPLLKDLYLEALAEDVNP